MTNSEKAIQLFKNNFNCAQAVLSGFNEEFGMSQDQCLKISCAFGGGMARKQLTCGAVTGALMAIGLKYGRGLNEDPQKKTDTYKKSLEFIAEFEKKHGSISCKTLMKNLDMNKEEDVKKINELKIHETLCVEYVKDAIQIADKVIGD